MDNVKIQATADAKLEIPNAQDQFSPYSIGRKTYNFVKSCMKDPDLRVRIQARAAEIRANGEYGLSAANRVAGHE